MCVYYILVYIFHNECFNFLFFFNTIHYFYKSLLSLCYKLPFLVHNFGLFVLLSCYLECHISFFIVLHIHCNISLSLQITVNQVYFPQGKNGGVGEITLPRVKTNIYFLHILLKFVTGLVKKNTVKACENTHIKE